MFNLASQRRGSRFIFILIIFLTQTLSCGLSASMFASYVQEDNGLACRIDNALIKAAHVGFIAEFLLAGFICYLLSKISPKKFPNLRVIMITVFCVYVVISYMLGTIFYPWVGANPIRCDYNYESKGVRIKKLVESHETETAEYEKPELFKSTLKECGNSKGRVATINELMDLIPSEIVQSGTPFMTLEGADNRPQVSQWQDKAIRKVEKTHLWTRVYCIVP